MSIDGRSIIVTGAASGIGAETARRLSIAGARVTAVDISEKGLHDVVEDVKSLGGEISGIVANVSELSEMDGVTASVASESGAVDAIVGCAGVADLSSVDSGDPDRWGKVLTVNALGVMVTARSVLPQMLRQGYGDIVIVTSASGRITYVGEPAYVASKHAAVAFLDSLRKEVAGTDIRVTSIEPGLVDTPMSRSHPFIDTILSEVEPLQPSDVAGVIEYCLSLPTQVNLNEVVVRPTRQEL